MSDGADGAVMLAATVFMVSMQQLWAAGEIGSTHLWSYGLAALLSTQLYACMHQKGIILKGKGFSSCFNQREISHCHQTDGLLRDWTEP